MRSVLVLLFMTLMATQASAVFCVSAHRLDTSVLNIVSPKLNAARLKAGEFKDTEFRTLQESWLENITPLGSRKDMFRATIQGHAVIGKKDPKGKLKEAAWVQELNSIGLGPKLHGLVKRGEDTYFIMADVGGINTQTALSAPAGFKLNAEVIKEMRRQLDIMIENGIYPFDIQFQISLDRKRVTLIDPEMFSIMERGTSHTLASKLTLDTLMMNWRMDDRIED